MSNIAQFYTKGIPVGGAIQNMPFVGDLYQPGDGTEWLCDSPSSAFTYSSAYANAPDFMISSHPLVNGPETGGTFRPSITTFCVAYDKANTKYVVGPYRGVAGYGLDYYYSGDDGSTWTLYTLTTPVINYTVCQFVSNAFYFVASGNSSNIIRTTDGINLTTKNVTGIGSITCQDILANGNNVLIIPTGTTGAYSADGGNTFALSTFSAAPTTTNIRPGSGAAAWCPGANAWICSHGSTAGTYQLSTNANGSSWSLYSTITSGTANVYVGYFSTDTKYASNSTTTIAMGQGGFFATTTDGTTWSNHGFIANDTPIQTINQFYYDGSQFVVRSGSRVWYGSNTTNWAQGKPLGGFATAASQSSGVLFPVTSTAQAGIPAKILKVSNVASTSAQTIIISGTPNHSTTQTYYRIK